MRTRVRRDAALAAVLVIASGLSCVYFDATEHVLTPLLQRWEPLQLDDLLLTAVFAMCATGWFALRRYREAVSALRAQRASERKNEEYVARLEQLSAQLLTTEQTERTRIAELLHDEVGQTLFACHLQLERARRRVADPAVHTMLAEAQGLSDEAMAHTRDLSAELCPPILHDLGLMEALEWLLSRAEARFGIAAQLAAGEVWQRVPKKAHDAVFQSIRELIANAVKHGHAHRVDISVSQAAGVIAIEVRDDGQGFAPDHVDAGFGLLSIERRMAYLGAALRVESGHERGTRAYLLVPGEARAAAG